MKKPTLVILAAGMGSRYGGLKQMDAFGPNGEAILDYSIYDAIRAGFGKIVFIIRDRFKEDFINFFQGKFDDQVEVEYVMQELDMLPEGYACPAAREKPWGTAHAVWVAKDVVYEPFAVINADDYYGIGAYETLVQFLTKETDKEEYGVVGYYLENTLSDHGTVNRGICEGNALGYLENVEEIVKIHREEDGTITYPAQTASSQVLTDETLVSMNMWAFHPSYFDFFNKYFSEFLDTRMHEPKSEYFIPKIVDTLIRTGERQVRILTSKDEWFGVTYQDDKPHVMEKLSKLIESGKYPSKLWLK
jgi:dTDP-glucose pyrophosphorylase